MVLPYFLFLAHFVFIHFFLILICLFYFFLHPLLSPPPSLLIGLSPFLSRHSPSLIYFLTYSVPCLTASLLLSPQKPIVFPSFPFFVSHSLDSFFPLVHHSFSSLVTHFSISPLPLFSWLLPLSNYSLLYLLHSSPLIYFLTLFVSPAPVSAEAQCCQHGGLTDPQPQ